MKKLIIASSLMLAFSCGKKNIADPANSNKCQKTSETYLKDIEAWSQDQTNKTKCEAVKKSLNAVLNDCSVYTAAQRKEYEEQLKDFTCD